MRAEKHLKLGLVAGLVGLAGVGGMLVLSACRMDGAAPRGAVAYERALMGPAMAAHAAQDARALEGERPANTEEYDRIRENPFLAARANPLSTFSVDVDTASYSNVRRFLSEGRLPPADAVRIEELVNYFRYDYPRAEGNLPFSAIAEVSACPWKPAHRLVKIGLKGREIEPQALPPRNLVFLVDVSGSMNGPQRLGLVKASLSLLADQLTERDQVAIAVYAGSEGLVLPATSGAHKDRIKEALGRLEAGGSTNGGAGIRLAYSVARESFKKGGINRVILATDGDFNVGVTSRGELVRLVERERESGVFLTVLGYGMGNYKDATMEQLAASGNGNYAYIDSLAEAKKVLVEQAGGTLVTIAKDVKVQVEWNPARVAAYRLIGYENRLLRAEDFKDDKKDAGEIGAGHTVTALYEVVPAGQPSPAGGVDPLRYQEPGQLSAASAGRDLATIKLRYKEPEGDASKLLSFPVADSGTRLEQSTEDFRFAAAVAGFGMLLRGSKHKGDATWASVLALARGALSADVGGYRREFVKLAERAASLAGAERLAAEPARR